jgi:hypothetical protein
VEKQPAITYPNHADRRESSEQSMGIVRFALRFPHTFYVVAALILFLGIAAIRVTLATSLFSRSQRILIYGGHLVGVTDNMGCELLD